MILCPGPMVIANESVHPRGEGREGRGGEGREGRGGRGGEGEGRGGEGRGELLVCVRKGRKYNTL